MADQGLPEVGTNLVFWILATLAGAVTSLWKIGESKNAKAIEELRKDISECQEDRDVLRKEMFQAKLEQARMHERLDICEGK